MLETISAKFRDFLPDKDLEFLGTVDFEDVVKQLLRNERGMYRNSD